MYPDLFRIGDFVISSFGPMLVAAFLVSYLQLRWGLRYLEIGDEEDAASMVFWAGIAGIVGAKLYYALLNGDLSLLLDRSGLVWYGGFLLAAAAVIWVMRTRRLPVWPTFDAATLGLAVGYAVGRIGCFLVGDDYGRPTDLPWGVAFPEGAPPSTAANLRAFSVDIPASVPAGEVLTVHPTQLYETAMALVIWGIGLWLLKKRSHAAGVVGLAVLSMLAVERFLVEILRAKDDRFFGGLTMAQMISIGVFLVALALIAQRRKAGGQSAATRGAGGRRGR
jgi:phosphatidylglycerol:prolipoprotein diacylglycerol transferase